MNDSENYVEPKAPGETGDQADSVRISRILHGIAVPLGLLITGVGAVAVWKEQNSTGRAGDAAAQGLPGHGDMMAFLGSATCLIVASGVFLVVLGWIGLVAMRRLSRQR